uniref:Heterogeneous nuclear ribonucleoprotein A/B n=1 Tax=Phallusia mammillata TaxID=59560 RepID=A0A6F9DE30_9ASCI|nr:heterogeneous nuclear ribonucleoprotein A/B [Phallusia mammillata]
MADNENADEIKQEFEEEQSVPVQEEPQLEQEQQQQPEENVPEPEIKTENEEQTTEENAENAENTDNTDNTEAVEQTNVETNGNGEEAVEGGDGEGEKQEDKQLEEGALINATEDNDAKMFIGGLSWDTQNFTLREYFEKYGKVRDCTIKKDSKTERSRGFGFVLFEDPKCVDEVMKCKDHWLDGRHIDPKRAEAQRKDGKLFVGGISTETEDDTIREHFSQFGEIDVLERPTDRNTGKKRGFCFITFKKDGVLKLACAERNQELDGKSIDVKEAQQQLERGNRFMGRGGGMGRGGWGGPPGGYGGGGGFGYGGGYGGGYDGYGGGYGAGGGGFGGHGGYGNYGFQGGYGGGGKGSKPREGLGRRRGGGWGDTRTHSNHINWYGHRGQFHGAYHGYHDY